jgi:hypothetical protein
MLVICRGQVFYSVNILLFVFLLVKSILPDYLCNLDRNGFIFGCKSCPVCFRREVLPSTTNDLCSDKASLSSFNPFNVGHLMCPTSILKDTRFVKAKKNKPLFFKGL